MTDKNPKDLGKLPQGNFFDSIPDLTKIEARRENNRFSQQNHDKNIHKFTGQALYVYQDLKDGRKLNAEYAREVRHIKHLARRIGTLGENGLDIDREWGIDRNGEQDSELVYFLPENRKQFIKNKWIIDRKRWWFSDKYTPSEIIAQIKENNQK